MLPLQIIGQSGVVLESVGVEADGGAVLLAESGTEIPQLDALPRASRLLLGRQESGELAFQFNQTLGLADPLIGRVTPARLLRAEFVTAPKAARDASSAPCREE